MDMRVSAETARQGEGRLTYKWIVAIVVIFGIFMSVLDTTIVNIAVSRLQTAFGSSLNDVQWVVTGYILAQGVVTPLTGYFSDRFGIKRVYIVALAGFTIGSALCGLAWNLPVLITFRVLQGVAGALLMPISIAMLYREFPPAERGMAIGVLGVPILLAPALGPTLGGYIVTFADWPLIFYINVPIGILGVILGSILLHDVRSETRARFDLWGFVTSGAGLALLLYGLSSASADGWESTTVIGCLGAGVLLLVAFAFIEMSIIRHEGQPLLDLRGFANGPFLSSNIASMLVTFALYGGLFIVPIYLQNIRQLSAFQAGVLLFPQALASMLAVVIGGRIVDKMGVRIVVLPGLVLLAFVNWQLTRLGIDTPYGTIQFYLVLRGFALGLCAQPLVVSALSEIAPRQLERASATNTALRFIASSLGVAVVATTVQTQTSVHYAHLAERVTPQSNLGQLALELRGLFISRGAGVADAWSTALQTINGLVERQAFMLATQDVFLLSFSLCIVAIIATLFVRSRKAAPTSTEGMSEEERHEAERSREEAMIAG